MEKDYPMKEDVLAAMETNVTFVVQGPEVFLHGKNVTKSLIEELSLFFPESEVVFSTWEECVDTYTNCHVINNTDPGSLEYENSRFLFNIKRQCVSTISGLRAANGRYAFKIRSDSLIQGEIFDVQAIIRRLETACNSNKIALFYHTCPTKPYVIDDRVQFGLTKTMLNFWDFDYDKHLMELGRFRNQHSLFKRFLFNEFDNVNISPEQLMFLSYCGLSVEPNRVFKMYLDFCKNIQKNFLVMESAQYGILSTKWKIKKTWKNALYVYMANKKSLLYLNATILEMVEFLKLFKKSLY